MCIFHTVQQPDRLLHPAHVYLDSPIRQQPRRLGSYLKTFEEADAEEIGLAPRSTTAARLRVARRGRGECRSRSGQPLSTPGQYPNLLGGAVSHDLDVAPGDAGYAGRFPLNSLAHSPASSASSFRIYWRRRGLWRWRRALSPLAPLAPLARPGLRVTRGCPETVGGCDLAQALVAGYTLYYGCHVLAAVSGLDRTVEVAGDGLRDGGVEAAGPGRIHYETYILTGELGGEARRVLAL